MLKLAMSITSYTLAQGIYLAEQALSAAGVIPTPYADKVIPFTELSIDPIASATTTSPSAVMPENTRGSAAP
jgi:hypothetical protein